MKNYIIIALTILILGCKNDAPRLIDFPIDKIIEYNALFKQNEFEYYVYIFSNSCIHCNEIKNEIIDFDNNITISMYFIQFSPQINVNKDIESTIGCNNIEDFSILGTPSLILIKDKLVVINLGGKKAILNHLKNH